MAKSKKKKSVISVNFEGVEARVLVPEDDYKVKVVGYEREDGDKAEYIAWKLEITDGEFEGKNLYTNTSLSENALWRFRTFLEAQGVEVPDGVMDVDLDEIVETAAEFGVTVAHEDYEGRARAQVVEYFPASEDKDEEEDDKKSGKGKKGKSKDKDEDDEEDDKKSGKGKNGKSKDKDEEKPDEDTVMEMDEDELEECIDTHDLDVDLDDHGTLKKKRKAVWEALEEEGDKKGKSEKYSEDAIMEMGTKELKAVLEKHDIELELEGSTKSKRLATLKALKKEDLIED